MKSFLLLCVSCTMAFTIFGNGGENEAVNTEEVLAVQEFLEDDGDGSFYVTVGLPHALRSPDALFEVKSIAGHKRSGEIPLKTKLHSNVDVGVGFAKDSSNQRLRYEAGFKWMRFRYDRPRYTHFDFAPVSLDIINENTTVDGGIDARGPTGSVYYDVNIGDSDSFDEWVYLGTTFGLLELETAYKLNIADFSTTGDSSAWTKVNQVELGAIWGINDSDNLKIQIGFEWMRLGKTNFENVDGNGSLLSLTKPVHRYIVKLGLLNFFRKR